jgi:chemotaxis family two-component system response regulator Rcp1
MTPGNNTSEVEILLVEDNPGDVLLTQEALLDGKVDNRVHWAKDGDEAIAFLEKRVPFENVPRPHVVFLDLNLPRKSGHEVLTFIKSDQRFKSIPVVILTSSKAESDILRSYDHYANCYVTKPVDLDKFMQVIRSIDHFWLKVVMLPHPENET